ncbi:MAG TPA: hypothetical protein VF348_06695 [Usitatibacter sp.]
MSKLFDRLKNAARLRGRGGADHSLLTQALQRAARERAQARAANGPHASDSAIATAKVVDDENWAKLLAANDDVDARAADEISHRDAEAELHEPQAADGDPQPDPPTRRSRRRVARGIAGALALVALVALVVVSLRPAQPPPVPVFQLDKTLR